MYIHPLSRYERPGVGSTSPEIINIFIRDKRKGNNCFKLLGQAIQRSVYQVKTCPVENVIILTRPRESLRNLSTDASRRVK